MPPEEIGKVYQHINAEVANLHEKINSRTDELKQAEHDCQMRQLQVISDFKLETSKAIDALTTTVTSYVTSAKEHEEQQESMMKRMLAKTDSHNDKIRNLEEFQDIHLKEDGERKQREEEREKEYKSEKKSRKKLRVTVYLAVAGILAEILLGMVK